jgi:hypothetical protein
MIVRVNNVAIILHIVYDDFCLESDRECFSFASTQYSQRARAKSDAKEIDSTRVPSALTARSLPVISQSEGRGMFSRGREWARLNN